MSFAFQNILNEVAVNSRLALGCLYQLQTYSMPRFALGASPFVTPGEELLLDALRQVAIQQEHMASQLAEAILLRGDSIPKGTYPMHYTSLHDLDLRYLFSRILDEQRRVVRVVEELTHSLREDEFAQRLAQEVRRNETAHLRLFDALCLRYPTLNGHRRDVARAVRQPVSEGAKKLRARAASRGANSDAQVAPWGLAG